MASLSTVDRSPAGLSQATLRFHEHYGSDFLKITPHGGYAVEAWGCVEAEEVLPDGHRACASCAVKTPDDWKRIRPLDPHSADGYSQQIETIIRMGFDRRIGDAPVLPTFFSPLSLAHKLSGASGRGSARASHAGPRGAGGDHRDPGSLRRRGADRGVSGIFYSIQAASRTAHAEEIYAEFGEPYDRRILDSIAGRSFLTIVHCHGDAPHVRSPG
mgnify:CR=1 FL=1